MITRSYQQKDLMFICDFPLVNEEKRGVAYVEPSSTTFKDALGSASFLECKNLPEKYLISSSTACFTYLSLTRPTSTDFGDSIVSKRGIPEGSQYIELPWLKDVWVSSEVYESIQGLLEEIQVVKPKLIIIAGKWAFMLLASLYLEPTKQLATIAGTKSTIKSEKIFGGLNKFRASILTLHEYFGIEQTIVMPILTPSYLFLVKDKEFVVKRDYAKIAFLYRRIKQGIEVNKLIKSERKAELGLANTEVFSYLNTLLDKLEVEPTLVSMDIETRQGYIDCIGIAYDEYESLTIPYSEIYKEINTDPNAFAYVTKNKVETLEPCSIGVELTKYRSYWSFDDELAITELLHKVMLHPNCLHVGQNYNYDCQYYFQQAKINISSHCDTMILHHVLHNTLQKDLAMLASIYCMDFVYWKDEIDIKDNYTRWTYNGKDCMYTLSIAKLLLQLMKRQDQELQEFYRFQQFNLNPNIVKIMNRGVLTDNIRKEELRLQFTELMEECLRKINYIFMEDINLNSTPQVKRAFKELLGIKPIRNRKTKSESFGSDAMLVYLEEYPEWRTLLTLFLEYKSIKVFVKTFLSAKLDADGRMRCDYNPAGTKTYRLSSRKNVFGNGMNLANIPSKGKIDLRVALQEYSNEDTTTKVVESAAEVLEFQTDVATFYEGKIELPNCKKIFLPDDNNWVFFDGDYSAGDLHFVVWEADCSYLKKLLREGKDPYSVLASEYYQREITKADDERQIFKAVCHGCLTGEHEVLTKTGWVQLDNLSEETEIAVWNKANRDIHFEVPVGINRDFVEADEDLYEVKGTAFHQLCTQDHTFPYTVDTSNNLKATQAIKLPKSSRLPYNGHFVGGDSQVQPEYMQLIAALQADSNIAHTALDGTVTYRFKFVRERKITRLRSILVALGIDFKEWTQRDESNTTGNIRTCFSFKDILQPSMKKLDWWILNYSKECIQVWLDELKHWDGHVRTSNGVRTSISTTDKLAAEIIQTVAHLNGYGSKILTIERDKSRKTIYEVSLNNRLFHNMDTGSTRLVKHSGTKVYCPKTSTGFFMVRYKGNVMVTGNSNYLGQANTLAAKAGLAVSRIKKVQDIYFRLCPEIPEWHRRLEAEARSTRCIRNIWGAKNEVWDFHDPMWMNKLVAWQPQSSLAVLVNKALAAMEEVEQGKNIQTKLQTHDSLSGQFIATDTDAVRRIINYMEVEIPYKDKLVIPADIKISAVSYGDCEKIDKDSPYSYKR